MLQQSTSHEHFASSLHGDLCIVYVIFWAAFGPPRGFNIGCLMAALCMYKERFNRLATDLDAPMDVRSS